MPGRLIYKVMGFIWNQVSISALAPAPGQWADWKYLSELLDRKNRLNEIGIAVFVESDTLKLLELIVMGAKSLANTERRYTF